MRLLVLSNLLPPRGIGGFELSAYNLSSALRGRGHEVRVVTSGSAELIEGDRTWVDRCLNAHHPYFTEVTWPGRAVEEYIHFLGQVSNVENTLLWLERIHEFRPEHIMIFDLKGIGGLGLVRAARLTGVPVTLNLGDDVPGALLERVPEAVREVYRVDSLFAGVRAAVITRTLHEEISRSVRLGQVEYIARGVMYADTPRTRPYREAGVTRFVFAGGAAPHKGADLVLKAAQRLVESGTTNFVIEYYGWGADASVVEAARRLGVEAHVSVVGKIRQHELVRAEAAADAFLFPTWHREPGGSAPGEALAVGCIPIVTDDYGGSEWFVDGLHVLKRERSETAFAEAMAAVINGQVDLEAMARAGRRLVAGPLSWERSVRRLEAWLAGGTPRQAVPPFDYAAVAAQVVADDDAARTAWVISLKES